jgi:hypothetical protein
MTAKELLLERAPGWSEYDAEVALRAVERKHDIGQEQEDTNADAWGDLDAWSDAASIDTMRMLDEEEAAVGFSWEQRNSQ